MCLIFSRSSKTPYNFTLQYLVAPRCSQFLIILIGLGSNWYHEKPSWLIIVWIDKEKVEKVPELVFLSYSSIHFNSKQKLTQLLICFRRMYRYIHGSVFLLSFLWHRCIIFWRPSCWALALSSVWLSGSSPRKLAYASNWLCLESRRRGCRHRVAGPNAARSRDNNAHISSN